jgi:hypothetical protein
MLALHCRIPNRAIYYNSNGLNNSFEQLEPPKVLTGLHETESLAIEQLGHDVKRVHLQPVAKVDCLTGLSHLPQSLQEDIRALINVYFGIQDGAHRVGVPDGSAMFCMFFLISVSEHVVVSMLPSSIHIGLSGMSEPFVKPYHPLPQTFGNREFGP